MIGCQHCQSPHVFPDLTMRQFEWRWLYGSVWVSALHIFVCLGLVLQDNFCCHVETVCRMICLKYCFPNKTHILWLNWLSVQNWLTG